MSFFHRPVMPEEAITSLRCLPGGTYIDGTVGGGGHALEILQRTAPDGRLVGFDLDEEALAAAGETLGVFGARVVLQRGNFARMAAECASLGISHVDGILLDLGVSSHQLEAKERGFSFSRNAPLDMRMDRRSGMRADEALNTLDEEELAGILREYGEEPMADRIAHVIAKSRKATPVRTTGQLADLVSRVVPPRRGHRIHPATRTFQAIRILVNGELTNLRQGLREGMDLLAPGGRLVVISYHSLEDRTVKETFRAEERGCRCPPDIPRCVCGQVPRLRIVTKKPLRPAPEEVRQNPRSRSAKLRAAARI